MKKRYAFTSGILVAFVPVVVILGLTDPSLAAQGFDPEDCRDDLLQADSYLEKPGMGFENDSEAADDFLKQFKDKVKEKRVANDSEKAKKFHMIDPSGKILGEFTVEKHDDIWNVDSAVFCARGRN